MEKYVLPKFAQRFISKIAYSGTCWNWLASKTKDGYGQFRLGRTYVRAHRMAWTLFIGSIPDEILVLHRCDNRICVNPRHLFLGTVQDNSDDKVKKKRHGYGETHPMAKLNEKDIENIRSMSNRGYSQRQLAKIFNCSKTNIADIIHGRRWKHV